MPDESQTTCPHCGAPLAILRLPEALSDHAYDLACFDDRCPYYVRGWTWMEEKFGVRSSYRYRVDPRSGHASPLAVWSPTALRSSILPGPPELAGRKELP
ncbi:MAG TPA: hypothetical protein VLD85_11720 [Anaeromyxobacteraceae bacterium]|nr:hypothetical protein [Anaeromyxobacteraceae bacterium]